MKNCTKHFWREKARAPVNVCPFRNRLFCIRSDIHCDIFSGTKVLLEYRVQWIKTLVTMATDSSHRVIMAKTKVAYFLASY